MERKSKKGIKINSLEEALSILLDKIGNSMNAAYIFGESADYSIFVYESMLYPRSDFKIPLEPVKLRRFLYGLFNPFLYKGSYEMNSMIRVSKLDRKAKSDFRLNMLLYLKKGFVSEVESVLRRNSDSTKEIRCNYFCMD